LPHNQLPIALLYFLLLSGLFPSRQTIHRPALLRANHQDEKNQSDGYLAFGG